MTHSIVCYYTEWHQADCCHYLNVMLSAIMLNAVMLSVVMLNVVMLSVVAPFRLPAFDIKIQIIYNSKQATLMRRSTVLSLSLLLVFPVLSFLFFSQSFISSLRLYSGNKRYAQWYQKPFYCFMVTARCFKTFLKTCCIRVVRFQPSSNVAAYFSHSVVQAQP